MEKSELIQMTGSEEQANYAMKILLKQVKPEFVHSVIKAELAEIEAEIKALEAEGYVVMVNGSYSANWGKAMALDGWNLSPEQEAAFDAAWNKCSKVEALLYRRNRTISLIAVR